MTGQRTPCAFWNPGMEQGNPQDGCVTLAQEGGALVARQAKNT